MGMDVYGKNPNSEVGKYFRNNVWWWHPLWDYCCKIAPDLIGIKVANACHHNDGRGLTAAKARMLGERLLVLAAKDEVKQYAETYKKEMDSLPDEICETCGGTGQRKEPPETGPGDVPCNGCNSTGKTRPFTTWYAFDEENVIEFAKFCIECGGFKVC